MDTVASIVEKNGGVLFEIDPNASVLEAAQRMNQQKIGSLIVREQGRLAGIITERDLLTRVVAAQRHPATTRVEEVMTRNVQTCRPNTPIREAREIMREKRVRHLPVCEGDRVLGMVSIGDLNAVVTAQLDGLVSTLEEYITRG